MRLQELEFVRDGAVVIPGAFDATGATDALWGFLERRYRHVRDDPTTWTGKLGKGLKGFAKTKAAPEVMSDTVGNAVTRLFGSPSWHTPDAWGPLVTFPTSDPWQLPTTHWHIDFPAGGSLTHVRMFGYLDHVRPTGGGTLIVAGSHRLVDRHRGASSKEVRLALAEESPWFADLWFGQGADRIERHMTDGEVVDGVEVRVVELTGEPGDIVLWHPSTFHAASPNTTATPRFMFSHTAVRTAAG